MNTLRVVVAVVLISSLAYAGASPLTVIKVMGPNRLAAGEGFTGSVVLAGAEAADREVVVQWRDTYGRIGGQQRYTVPAGEDRLTYELKVSDPIARRGRIEAVVDGVLQVEHVKFDVVMPPPQWDDYVAFAWAHYPHGYYEKLRDYGITGGMLYRAGEGDHYHDNNFPVYIDQMGWEIFAYYHKRRSIWDHTIEDYGRNPRDWSLVMRRPCLVDEGSFLKLRQLYGDMVSKQRFCRPLFYNLADEIGLGDQSGANDFCWEYVSRDGFRDFLMETYGHSVARLNDQWGSNYRSWSHVRTFHPTTYSQYDRLHREIYLPRDFASPDSETFVERFGSIFPSFDKAIELYAAIRTSDPVDEAYLLKLFAPRSKEPEKEKDRIVKQLNESYGCGFESLADVVAFNKAYDEWSFGLTVDRDRPEDMKGWNLSPWVDFRTYMDRQMADGMRRAVAIGKEFDPDGRFGFTGSHHPGAFNAHNYALLCPIVGLIVPYNIGGAPEIIRSLNPETCYQILPSWKTGDVGVRDIWTRLLHGDRGIIFWDNEEPKNKFLNQPDKTPTERATSLGPTLVEIESGIAKQLIASRRDNNGIAIYYSHPTIRVDYWRSNLHQGRRWVGLRSWNLYPTNRRNLLRTTWFRVIEDLNLQYDVISAEKALQGHLETGEYKVLILPEVIAISEAEADAIRRFVEAGGVVIADRFCGLTDEHGKWLAQPRLADLWTHGNAHVLNVNVEPYMAERTEPEAKLELGERVGAILADAGIRPAVRVKSSRTDAPLPAAEAHVFHAGGGVRVVGLTRNISLAHRGIGGTEKVDNSVFEKTEQVNLEFDRPVHVYDQRAGKSLGQMESHSMNLDAWSAPVLVLTDEPLPPVEAKARQDGLRVTITLSSAAGEVVRAVHVEVRDPQGRTLRHYSGNALIQAGSGEWLVPLAANDPAGVYVVSCRDVLTGQVVEVQVQRGEG